MQHYFWGLEGRTTWPSPHRDKTFLASAVMAVGEKRFGTEWVGREGIPSGLQWQWVRDFIVSMCGAGAIESSVLSPTLSRFHPVDAAAWKDKRKTKSIFSRCQFVWPEAHPAYWDKSPVYADIYLDRYQLEESVSKIATVPLTMTVINLTEFYVSTYLDVMLQVAQEHLRAGEAPPTAEQLAVIVAEKLYPILNPGESYDPKKSLQEHPRKNGWSPQIAKNISSLLRGPERINERGRLAKNAKRRP